MNVISKWIIRVIVLQSHSCRIIQWNKGLFKWWMLKSCAVLCTHFSGKNVLHPIHAREACPPPSAHGEARSPIAVSGLECLCNLHLETRQCRLRLGCSGNAAFLPLHYFILWWFYDGLREENPGKDGGKKKGCAQLAQVTKRLWSPTSASIWSVCNKPSDWRSAAAVLRLTLVSLAS